MILPVPIPVGDVKGLKAQVAELDREVQTVRTNLQRLQTKFDRQGQVLRALYAVLLKTTGIQPSEFLEIVQQEETVRTNTPPQSCLACNRVVSKLSNRCIYCGELRPPESALDLF